MKQPSADARRSFGRFWAEYLDAHRKRGTRAWHYAATATGITFAGAGFLLDEVLIVGAGFACGYVMAIGSHHWIERNKSLMVINPFFGYIADLRMCWHALTGTLAQEYHRLGLAPIDRPRDKKGRSVDFSLPRR
ncbi:DUF962 domain-containing protein [Dongia soli]|uniref:DUF962 domain-containing protein n=1 Tax=Dongia soli TaxID=600628 RepID=A0ABU5EEE2_9PROT|nr:DUF962 domain-containing protein [Dongia soli]MDY0884199.1 DUF962 domain-containing protein [Dongia soli]